MKKLIVTVMLIIPVLGFTQSADKMMNQNAAPAPAPAASASYSAKAMETTFTANSLDEQQVGTFQERSIQKLKDFYNYLTIISNPKFDNRLKENVKIQANQLFYGQDCKVDGKHSYDFIDSCFNLKAGVEWKASNISVSKNMSPKAKDSATGFYRGELTFKESVNGKLSKVKKVEIILSKSEKMFGESKREVWSVFICTIE